MRLTPGEVTDAAVLGIRHDPVDADQVVSGAPATGHVEFVPGVGVREMTQGAMRDVEA